jgi:hypothetical protein
MRDCPACRVPLHGYEEVCPSCGTKQIPSRSSRTPYGAGFKAQEPGVNWLPFVLAFLGFGIFVVVAMQGSWIGQLMRGENKGPDDPIAKMSYVDARNFIDAELQKNLAAAGATDTKITWRSTANSAALDASGQPAQATDDRAVDGPVELTVDTKLPDKSLAKQVVEPIKPYMEPGKVVILNVNDAKSRAHITFNLQQTTSPENPQAGFE